MRETHLSIHEASRADLPKIQIILRQARLSTDDILIEGTRYWLAESVDGHALGVVGLELGEADVLLRSAAVRPSCAVKGLALPWSSTLWMLPLASNTPISSARVREPTGNDSIFVKFLCLNSWRPDHKCQVKRYEILGWLPTERAWRRGLK